MYGGHLQILMDSGKMGGMTGTIEILKMLKYLQPLTFKYFS